MKRRPVIFLLLLVSCLAMQAHEYVTSSILGNGRFVKIQVTTSGIHRITYEQLQSWGLKPNQVRIFGYGGNLIEQNFSLPHIDDLPSIPFYMHAGSDGVFSAGDYILFYAAGPIGWNWKGSYYAHTRNCYADYGCYFLSDDAGEQRLLTLGTAIEADAPNNVDFYTALQLHELEQRNLIDVSHGKDGGGREWYGEVMTTSSSRLSVPFTFKDVDTTHNFVCRIDAAANGRNVSTMQVTVADVSRIITFAGIDVSDFYSMAKAGSATITSAKPKSEALNVALNYKLSNQSDIAYLNYIEMQVPCHLHLRDNCLLIRNTEFLGEAPSRYRLTGADANTQIWNLTHPEKAYQVPTTWANDTLCWIGSNNEPQLYVAVRTTSTSFPTPASRGTVSNQNLHATLRGAQHVIITPEEFRPAAEHLKQAHERHTPSQRWAVVSDEEVFNEFSSGTPDASAFRWMMKYLYDSFKNTEQAPRSLLLLGDGSFDNRRILKTSPVPTLLTYEAHNSLLETAAYATDDYFGFLEDKDGVSGSNWDDKRARMAIGVGRLPVNTYEEAKQVVHKIEAYMQNATAGSWQQQLCFLADDGDNGTHVVTADVAAELVRAEAPDYIINKIYLDAYVQESSASGESYPLAYNRFCNMLQTGVSLMDYAGHGSANNICSEMFLTRKQVEGMSNTNQGVWALATCNFARFDQADPSTAEVAVLNPIGGAVAVISADRTVYASENEILNKYFCQNLFYHTDPFTYPYTIGEALRLAKNKNGDNMNKLPFVLLGDPALSLNYPTQYQVVVSEMPDTLHALDLVTIQGYISNGDILTSSTRRDTVPFNGQVSVNIFDKIQTVTTRDNDETNVEQKHFRTFQDYPYKLFVGQADVVDGLFSFSFRIPKDIRYNIGAGRMTFYALGEVAANRAEALGHNEQFFIGGSSPWIIDDQQGPDIHLYLNTPLFKDGDRVNPTPHFYADLYDENGINAIGSGIGHDLLLTVDNDNKQSYVLNDYYTAENNSFQRGTINYIFPELKNGSHSLTFRAWDLLNNASTQSLGFTVDSDMGPVVKSLTVYPNLISQGEDLHFALQTDRPDDHLTVEIAFYNMVGAKVWATSQTLTDPVVTVSLAEASLPPGTYIYQLNIQTNTQTSDHHKGKIIVY